LHTGIREGEKRTNTTNGRTSDGRAVTATRGYVRDKHRIAIPIASSWGNLPGPVFHEENSPLCLIGVRDRSLSEDGQGVLYPLDDDHVGGG
jgi:hypothetical protein